MAFLKVIDRLLIQIHFVKKCYVTINHVDVALQTKWETPMGHSYMAEHGRSLLCHVLNDQHCVISDTLLLRHVSTNIVSHVRTIKTFIVSFAKTLETFIVSTIWCMDQHCVNNIMYWPIVCHFCQAIYRTVLCHVAEHWRPSLCQSTCLQTKWETPMWHYLWQNMADLYYVMY